MTFAIVAAVATIAGTATSVYGTVQAGKAQQDAFREQAEQEKIAAEGRELQRKQELNKVIAANAVSASMNGQTGEGTQASIALSSSKQIGSSEGMIKLSDNLKTAQTLRQAKNARATANINATTSLLSGAASAVSAYNTPTVT